MAGHLEARQPSNVNSASLRIFRISAGAWSGVVLVGYAIMTALGLAFQSRLLGTLSSVLIFVGGAVVAAIGVYLIVRHRNGWKEMTVVRSVVLHSSFFLLEPLISRIFGYEQSPILSVWAACSLLFLLRSRLSLNP